MNWEEFEKWIEENKERLIDELDISTLEITEKEFKRIEENKIRKEFLSRKPISRFSLMDI